MNTVENGVEVPSFEAAVAVARQYAAGEEELRDVGGQEARRMLLAECENS